jgi:phage shock protein A
MGIFKRLFKIGQASANKAVDALETPELMIEQAIKDKENEIKDAKKSVMECIATERQTKAELDKEKKSKSEWAKKAEAAVEASKDDLAVKALARSDEHAARAKSLEVAWKQQRGSVDELKTAITRMENELAEYKRNKDFILAQSKTADLKKKIYQTKANMNKESGADDLMARLKAKADRSVNEAEAAEEMAESFGGDSLENEFAELDVATENDEMQDRLAKLKEKLGKE